ncbi:MAG TPA: calcium-binding protein [Oculatellaceae cyanobacterium]|jgi:Ca2+-binding RTX toxin-like protein
MAVVTGTSGNDTLNGTSGNDTINGLAGDDVIAPGLGHDTVDGGTGTDVLVINYAANTYSGIQTNFYNGDRSSGYIYAYYTNSGYNQVNFSNIERYNITGTGADDTIYGAALNDTLIGGAGNDSLDAGAGNDTLDGGAGDDTLDGGTGTDSVDGGTGTDTLRFNYSASTTAINFTSTSSGTLSITGAGSVTYSNIEAFNLTGTNFNDTITGTANNDTFNGLAGDDIIAIGLGHDTVDGGTGTDVLVIDYSANTYSGISTNFDNSDRSSGNINAYYTGSGFNQVNFSNIERYNITGTESADSIYGAALNDTLIGGAGNDTLDAGAGNDTLNGGAGDNTLIGGDGDDTYVVDTTSDSIIETATGGIDTIQTAITWTLASYLENLTLTGSAAINGTGNTANNIITGNTGSNILNGNSGIDTLIGGNGNDTFIVDSTTDTISETATGGTDTVKSSVSYILGATSYLENLTLTGTSIIDGTGNSLNNTITGNNANNTLTGGDGNDTLNGLKGIDTLIGGNGNDTFIVDSTTDTISETATGGTDTVQSSVSYILNATSYLENLTLTGTSIIDGTGNSLNNTITGNTANNTLAGGDGNDNLNGASGIDTLIGGNSDDTLAGGAGDDLLTGNSGIDKFLYNTNATFATSTVGIDTITDFTSGIDKIVLDKTTFKSITSAVGTGFSIASEFATVTNDTDAAISNALIVYNTGNGNLFYNQNKAAAGFGTGAQFDILSGMPMIAATDFMIQA